MTPMVSHGYLEQNSLHTSFLYRWLDLFFLARLTDWQELFPHQYSMLIRIEV